MLTWTTALIIGGLAVVVGYGVGLMPCWQTRHGYVGLAVVATVAAVAGTSLVEIAIDCVGLGVGFALARR